MAPFSSCSHHGTAARVKLLGRLSGYFVTQPSAAEGMKNVLLCSLLCQILNVSWCDRYMDVSIYIPDMWKLLYLSWCSGLGTKCNDSEAEQGSADTDNYFKKKSKVPNWFIMVWVLHPMSKISISVNAFKGCLVFTSLPARNKLWYQINGWVWYAVVVVWNVASNRNLKGLNHMLRYTVTWNNE